MVVNSIAKYYNWSESVESQYTIRLQVTVGVQCWKDFQHSICDGVLVGNGTSLAGVAAQDTTAVEAPVHGTVAESRQNSVRQARQWVVEAVR